MPSKIDTYAARIEYFKSISDYHFDPKKSEEPFNILGTFNGLDWSHELRQAIAHSTPCTFGNMIESARHQGKINLQFDARLSGDQNYSAGHACFNSVPDEIFNREKCPTLFKMVDWFAFEPSSLIARIHVQMPGQMFPFHVDGLVKTGALDDPKMQQSSCPERLARVQVMLTDWVWGHAWAVGNNYWIQWSAGEILYHPWWNIPHGTANFGFSPRASLQISGRITDIGRAKLALRGADIRLT